MPPIPETHEFAGKVGDYPNGIIGRIWYPGRWIYEWTEEDKHWSTGCCGRSKDWFIIKLKNPIDTGSKAQ